MHSLCVKIHKMFTRAFIQILVSVTGTGMIRNGLFILLAANLVHLNMVKSIYHHPKSYPSVWNLTEISSYGNRTVGNI